ncbi:MAG: HEAT repeat domain-containing protein [Candidatus Hydrogenedentes bacterium]|nr:HEAT repeat domain-containing protein [Candidatus Hydrogenedentota bacterium]
MRYHITTILLAIVLAFGAAAQDVNPITVLQSDAPLVEKMDACRALSRQGTEEAIPVLAGLLLDEQLAHMARYALEPMPYPEAGAALRDALGKTTGLLKVGVISSLATRNDAEAVPALVTLVPDSDEQVAQAAAKALGDIGTPEAATGLDAALGNAAITPATRVVICDALRRNLRGRRQEGRGGCDLRPSSRASRCAAVHRDGGDARRDSIAYRARWGAHSARSTRKRRRRSVCHGPARRA